MTELVEKIRAAIALSEEAALGPVEKHWRVDGANSCQVYARREDHSNRTIAWCGNGHEDDFANVIHIAHNDPAAVLRQVAAHRKILELHGPGPFVERGMGRQRVQQCEYCASLCHSRSGLGCEEPADAVYPCPTVLALAEAYGIEP